MGNGKSRKDIRCNSMVVDCWRYRLVFYGCYQLIDLFFIRG